MNNKGKDFLVWLHQMREEEKKKRENQSVELYLKEIKGKTNKMLKENKINLPVVERIKINV